MKGSAWTHEEDDILEAYWPSFSRAEVAAKLPGRTLEACAVRAAFLGIVRHANWDYLDDRILKKSYPELGIKGCAKLLPHRTLLAIKARARLLGIKSKRGRKKVLTEAQINEIKARHELGQQELKRWGETYSAKALADAYDVHIQTIHQVLREGTQNG